MVVCVAINLLLLGQPGFDPDDLPSPQPPPFSPHVAPPPPFPPGVPVALGVALALRDLCEGRCSPRRRQFAGATTPPTAPVPEASVRTTAHPGEISYTVHANAARV